jgi:cytochrome c553
MFRWLAKYWKRLLGLGAIAVLVLACGAVLVMWSGVFNVAASRGHLAIVDALLRFAMVNSVQARAPDASPFPLGDHNRIALGAAHFHSGCAVCHGIPGRPINPVFRGMLPPPPNLKEQVGLWTDGELFWIVKHGLKYAGMPAWPSQNRDDEVWNVVAFLRKLPGLDTASYLALANGDLRIDVPEGSELATGMRSVDTSLACARCHGAEGIEPASDLVPLLHGQPVEMLAYALRAYADGNRYSGIMQPIASELPAPVIDELARYYASLPPLRSSVAADQDAAVEEGRRLASDGDARRGVPACHQCHGANALPLYPRLAGQSARYIEAQLKAWRTARGRTDLDAIMAPIARRLSDAQIKDAAHYYASLPAGAP